VKAYYIDPILKFVAQVDYSGDYKEIYKFIKMNEDEHELLEEDFDDLTLEEQEDIIKPTITFEE
jgi:hypothetical protein